MDVLRTGWGRPWREEDGMATLYVRLADPSDTAYFQMVFGAYGHVAWVRAVRPSEGLMRVIATPDTVGDAMRVLEALADEVDFDIVDAAAFDPR